MLLFRQSILRSGKVIDFSADGSIVLDVSSSLRLPETVGKDGWAANLDDPRYASSSSSPSVKLCVPPGACKTLEVFLPVMTLPQFWSPPEANAFADIAVLCSQQQSDSSPLVMCFGKCVYILAAKERREKVKRKRERMLRKKHSRVVATEVRVHFTSVCIRDERGVVVTEWRFEKFVLTFCKF